MEVKPSFRQESTKEVKSFCLLFKSKVCYRFEVLTKKKIDTATFFVMSSGYRAVTCVEGTTFCRKIRIFGEVGI